MPVIDRWTMQNHEASFPSNSCMQHSAVTDDSMHDHEYKTVSWLDSYYNNNNNIYMHHCTLVGPAEDIH